MATGFKGAKAKPPSGPIRMQKENAMGGKPKVTVGGTPATKFQKGGKVKC